MENKRIAIITHEYPPHRGGAGVYCEELAYAAKQIGSNIEVWAPRDAKNSDSFKVHKMPQKGSQDWICSLRLAKYIKKNSPHVDYLHFADPGALKALLRLGYFLKNIPPFIIKNKLKGIKIIELKNLLISSCIIKYYQNFF